jgi:hypothetical protein
MILHHLSIGMISLSLLLSLTGCSDATQFTEKTFASGMDAVTGEETDQPQAEVSSEDETSSPESSESPVTDPLNGGGENKTPVVYEGGDDPGQSQDNPAQSDSQTVTTQQLFTACEDYPERAIVAQVYPLPENTQKLPDFAALNDTGTDVCLTQLNIADRDFNSGFPGVPSLIEWFGLDLRFKLKVPSSGSYQFTLRSDDGANLYINGNKVVDNDGLHAVRDRSGNIVLTAGKTYDIRIAYYQGPRYRIALELFWTPPGSTTRSYIPAELLSRP